MGEVARFPVPKPLSQHGPARIIAMCNQKGGVGKTTTTVNLAASLAEYGRRVLVVDFDPQGALSVNFNADVRNSPTTYDLMMSPGLDPHTTIQKTDQPLLDVIPATITLSAAEQYLVSEVGRESILSAALNQIKDDYDVILIDCQPSLGLLTVNALTAAHGVLIPMATEFFAMRGVAQLTLTIDKVKSRLNPTLEIDGIIPTMHDPRTLHSKEVLESLEDKFGDKVFKTAVGRTIKFPEATVARKPITSFAPASSAAEQYLALAREFVARGCSA